MQLYIIDPENGFMRKDLIDEYESFIWTDRYAEAGDLTIVLNATAANVARLYPEVMIGSDESDRIQIVQSVLIEEDEEGKETMTVECKSYEWVLEGRVAGKGGALVWPLSGSHGMVATQLVQDVCVLGTGVIAHDVISNFSTTNLAGTDRQFLFNVEVGSLYQRVKEICDQGGVGFRVTLRPGSASLVFATYVGADRRGDNGVVFSKELQNISRVKQLRSHADFKTGAYVYSNFQMHLVDAEDRVTIDDFDHRRRILFVDAKDITQDGQTADQHRVALIQRGREQLAKHQRAVLFDGTVNPEGTNRYNRDYFLGDLCTMKASYGSVDVRVTEHIWSADSNGGTTSYPTLSAIGGV